MIIPMKKYLFLVHHADYDQFLIDLQALGLLHLKVREKEPSREEYEKSRVKKEIEEVIKDLEKRDVPQNNTTPDEEGGQELTKKVRNWFDQLEDLQQELNYINKEIGYLTPWGDFDSQKIEALREAGISIRFFYCPEKRFDPEWEDDYFLEKVSEDAQDIYFVIVQTDETAIGVNAEEVDPPEYSKSELEVKKAAIEEKIQDINLKLNHQASHNIPVLETALHHVEEDMEMARVIANSLREVENNVLVLEGFVPKTKEKKINNFCEENEIFYLERTPRKDDNPPVLLKNSRFTKLFEPIGELFSLPHYAELDLTPFFAPFFMLFFGFCLGDAGYGIVVILGATIYKFRAKPSLKPYLTLAQFLGVATILFGVLTGTFFGMNLMEEQFAWLGTAQDYMLDGNEAFNLALILGLVQILLGMALQAVNKARQFGFVHAISTIGWMILVLSFLDIGVLSMTGKISTYTAWGGVALILLFNDPEANILNRLGKGAWELYGITGVFGDLLSYIRLFALGISSAILGLVINEMALEIRGSIPILGPILFVIFLLVGHTANLLIASLGAFVHPLRLTFVEFYKNAGFLGGGKPYKPFSLKEKGSLTKIVKNGISK